jgi:hypothetical protein
MNHIGEISQLIGALVLAFNCWQTWNNGRKANRIAANVQVIEKATNSMKDALVAATNKAALAEGTAAGMVEGHAAGLDQGRNEERKPVTP